MSFLFECTQDFPLMHGHMVTFRIFVYASDDNGARLIARNQIENDAVNIYKALSASSGTPLILDSYNCFTVDDDCKFSICIKGFQKYNELLPNKEFVDILVNELKIIQCNGKNYMWTVEP